MMAYYLLILKVKFEQVFMHRHNKSKGASTQEKGAMIMKRTFLWGAVIVSLFFSSYSYSAGFFDFLNQWSSGKKNEAPDQNSQVPVKENTQVQPQSSVEKKPSASEENQKQPISAGSSSGIATKLNRQAIIEKSALDNVRGGNFNWNFINQINSGVLTFDQDHDGVPDVQDNCRIVENPNQDDLDSDRIGDVCDNCHKDINPDQDDFNSDGEGDACSDVDGDGIVDGKDNCPTLANTDQYDNNHDGFGDVCDNVDCPNPEFSMTFTQSRCSVYQPDRCGNFLEGSCLPEASSILSDGDGPHSIHIHPINAVAPSWDHLSPGDGYQVAWTSRHTKQLEDNCNNLWSGGTMGLNLPVYDGTRVSIRPTNIEGEEGSSRFYWGRNVKVIPNNNSTNLSIANRIAAWFWTPRLALGVQFFGSNRSPASDAAEWSDNFSFIIGRVECRVRAYGRCGKYIDYSYWYSCEP